MNNLESKIDNTLKGKFKLQLIDAKTNRILDEYEDNNIVVLDSRTAITRAISSPSNNSTIKSIKLGEDVGEPMTGSPNITFSNLNPDTIVRSSGSFITDGFVAGDKITVSNSVSNNGVFTIQSLTATTITLPVTEFLTDEGPLAGVSITTGSVDVPSNPKNTYTSTTMDVVFNAPYTLGVGYPDNKSVNFSVTIIGADVMALYPGDTSKIFTSAALHTGDGNVFAYKRFPKRSISELVNMSISWVITY